jgi:hypothetical protein
MLNDVIRNFSRTKLCTVSYALLLTLADPDFAKIRILKLIAGNVGRFWKIFDQIHVAVGAGLETGTIFGLASRAEHSGR